MIESSVIEKLIKEKIGGTDLFLVEVKIDSFNNISISVDSPNGVSVVTCVGISRHIEGSFDREEEDFSLEVSSPGIGIPFKVYEQYEKVLGKTVEVLFNEGTKLQGTLIELNKDNFAVEYSVKEKPEGAKRPIMVDKKQVIDFNNIKSTKEIITF
ncbi:MAG: ribosome assembly cofactor RimP [Salinivirgaceae bacterium]|jgi:ribosome maturation factor RimP|nr:ribosome assembly cofactor RimP [Salinivirgaceae bacterium]